MDQPSFLAQLRQLSHPAIVPVFGLDFMPGCHGDYDAIHLPSWRNLVHQISGMLDRNSRIPAEDAKRLQLFLKHGDYVSFVTLAQEKVSNWEQILERVFEYDWSSYITDDHMEPYHAFVACNWKAIASTDVDGLLEFAFRNELQATYATRDLLSRLRSIRESAGNDSLILRLTGRWRDVLAPPLLTWENFFRQLRLPGAFGTALVESLVGSVPPSEQEAYRAALTAVLPLPINAGESENSIGFVATLDELLETRHLFFIGISAMEPLWHLVRWRIQTVQAKGKHCVATTSETLQVPTGMEVLRCTQYSKLATLFVEYFRTIAEKVPGELREKRDREDNYTGLWKTYNWRQGDKFESGWMDCAEISGQASGDEASVSLVPFVEVWSNRGNLEVDEAVRIQPSPAKYFNPGEDIFQVREGYWEYREMLRSEKLKPEPMINEVKVRVNQLTTMEDGGVTLEIEPVQYKDYLVTNHFVANVTELERASIEKKDSALGKLIKRTYQNREGDFDPRYKLCRDATDIFISRQSKCSNHLGASALLIAKYRTKDGADINVVICPPSGNQISSPADIIPAISGSIDWPLRRDAKSWADAIPLADSAIKAAPKPFLSVRAEILREFHEECLSAGREIQFGSMRVDETQQAIEYAENQLKRLSLVNLCQNIQRGGKPELFFLASLRFSANYFLKRVYEPNWELKHTWWDISLDEINEFRSRPKARRVELYPSPLDSDLELTPNWEEAAEFLLKIVRNNQYNPVFRANVVSLFRYCQIHHSDRVFGWLRKNNFLSPSV